MLTEVALGCPMCCTATHWGGLVSSQVPLHCLLVWLCIILGIQRSPNVCLHVIPSISLLLIGVAVRCINCSTAARRGGFELSLVFHCCSWGGSIVISIVSLPFTKIALQHTRCFTASYCGGSMSFLVLSYCSMWWLCILPGVPLLLPKVTFHLFKYFNVPHWGDTSSFYVSYCH